MAWGLGDASDVQVVAGMPRPGHQLFQHKLLEKESIESGDMIILLPFSGDSDNKRRAEVRKAHASTKALWVEGSNPPWGAKQERASRY